MGAFFWGLLKVLPEMTRIWAIMWLFNYSDNSKDSKANQNAITSRVYSGMSGQGYDLYGCQKNKTGQQQNRAKMKRNTNIGKKSTVKKGCVCYSVK